MTPKKQGREHLTVQFIDSNQITAIGKSLKAACLVMAIKHGKLRQQGLRAFILVGAKWN